MKNPIFAVPAGSLLSKEQTHAKKAERLVNIIYTAFSPVISRVHPISLTSNRVSAVEKASVALTNDPIFSLNREFVGRKIRGVIDRADDIAA
ncbi:MAG TPA: hypothetical protein HPQ03_02820 [Deltaproteobacteria bacterium]|nr:hypothetical protein [Deltaproteobacteria bacterium]